MHEATKLFGRALATLTYDPPNQRFYDPQLDHWGIGNSGCETFQELRLRLEAENGPVWKWLASNNNAFHDNTIEGVNELHLTSIPTSTKIYYFSLSFHATTPFRHDWPQWTLDALRTFPVPLVKFIREVLYSIPLVNFGTWVVDRILSQLVESVGWPIVSRLVSFREVVGWATTQVGNRLLHQVGYNIILPGPGKYLPLKDVFPPWLGSVYAMGGLDLSSAQKEILDPDLGDWYLNDGIVNTESMKGPKGATINDIKWFPVNDLGNDAARGVYWHFGVNGRMDHADEIGVFIEEATVCAPFSPLTLKDSRQYGQKTATETAQSQKINTAD
jgi:hypothetical protein